MGYLSFTKTELVAGLRHFSSDTTVGILADLAEDAWPWRGPILHLGSYDRLTPPLCFW